MEMEGSTWEQGAEGEPQADKSGEILCVEDARSELIDLWIQCRSCVKRWKWWEVPVIWGIGECRRWLWGSCDSKSKNWLGEVQGMQGVAELKKVLVEAERNGLSELCKISDVWGGMIGTFWEKCCSLKWRARGSEEDQRRRGRCKWRRRARALVCRKRTPWIQRDGGWELERLLLG